MMKFTRINKHIWKGLLVLVLLVFCSGFLSTNHPSAYIEKSLQMDDPDAGMDSAALFCSDRPDVPDNVQSSDGAYWDRIKTTWDQTTCATYYEIYRSIGDATGPYTDYQGDTTELFWDFMTTDEVTRWFGVKACNEYGCSLGMRYDSTGGYAAVNFDTVGLYIPAQKKWYLKNTPENGWVDYKTVKFGGMGPDWYPVTGDWNGIGNDMIGLYNYSQGKWYLKTSLTDGWVNYYTVRFGSADTSWVPVTGDWNGNGTDTVGFYVPSQKKWYLKNTHNLDGWTDYTTVKFGSTDPTWQPIAGDWDLDGSDEIGFYVPFQKKWYLKNTLVNGWVDYSTIKFGGTGSDWIAVAGNWGCT